MIDLPLIWQSLPNLLHGTCMTLALTCIAAIIGLTLGSIFGLAAAAKSRLISSCIGVYVTFFRGTPMLVQILFLYYVLPNLGLLLRPFGRQA